LFDFLRQATAAVTYSGTVVTPQVLSTECDRRNLLLTILSSVVHHHRFYSP